jgi:serine/threonine protein kinase
MMIEIVTSDTESTQVSIDADQHHSQLPNWYNFVLIIVGAGIISIGCICIYRRHLRYRHNIKQQQIGGWSSSSPHQTVRFQPTMQPNILYTNRAILAESEQFDIDDDYYEIALDRLQFGRVIGQGAFGLVFLGTMRTDIATTASEQFHRSTPMTVAIKQLKPNADESEREQFLAEMNIMKLVGRQSQNVVAMYGYCTVQSPQCMVSQYYNIRHRPDIIDRC